LGGLSEPLLINGGIQLQQQAKRDRHSTTINFFQSQLRLDEPIS